MYDRVVVVESEKEGVPVEVQRWRVKCLALFNIKKSSLTLKHQKVKSRFGISTMSTDSYVKSQV